MGYKGVVSKDSGWAVFHCCAEFAGRDQKLLGEGVAVLLTTQCLYEPSDLTCTNPGGRRCSRGILQGFDMTGECAVTKMMWALGLTSDLREIRRMMYTDCCGEITPVRATVQSSLRKRVFPKRRNSKGFLHNINRGKRQHIPPGITAVRKQNGYV
jgi:hypothetical protein